MSAHPSHEQMAAHLDGSLSPGERAATAAHLEVCARCREELSLAGRARDILRELPHELEPPVDVADGVLREAAGRPAPGTSVASGSPRWYRAAAIAAVAAAIGLAAVVVPNLDGRVGEERAAEDHATAPNAAESAGPSGDLGAASSSPAADGAPGRLVVERVGGDLDAAGLHALLDDTRRVPLSSQDMAAEFLSEPEAGLVTCSRRAGGTAIVPPGARPVRLIAGRYEGIPARIVIFAVGRGPDGQFRAVVAAAEDCRLLAADAASSAPE